VDPVLAGPGPVGKSHRADCDPLPVVLAELVECPPMVLQNGPQRPPGEEDDRCRTSTRGLLSQRAKVRHEHEPASPLLIHRAGEVAGGGRVEGRRRAALVDTDRAEGHLMPPEASPDAVRIGDVARDDLQRFVVHIDCGRVANYGGYTMTVSES